MHKAIKFWPFFADIQIKGIMYMGLMICMHQTLCGSQDTGINLLNQEIGANVHYEPSVNNQASLIRASICLCGMKCNIGGIEYSHYDSDIKKPALYTLWVMSKFRKKGVATKLLALALEDFKKSLNKPTEVHFTANPVIGSPEDKETTLPLDELVSFYQKRGAILVNKQPSIAHMKFIIS